VSPWTTLLLGISIGLYLAGMVFMASFDGGAPERLGICILIGGACLLVVAMTFDRLRALARRKDRP
jgi:Na+/H+ antiporter NhaC